MGAAFIGVLGAVLWVFLAFWPATLAKRKGYSFILFFILSIIISWLITLIIVLFLKDKTLTAQDIADDKAAAAALERDENRKR